MAFQKLFGDKLVGKSGEVATSSLEGKFVLIYFSAHWCPPCRDFTPKLAKFYTDLKKKRDDFEIVFVSSDKTEAEFTEYYKEHPWLAFPYDQRKAKEKLSRKFKVKGIPTLVVLDGKGGLITGSGRESVSQDPNGEKFPWKPKGVMDILGDNVHSKSGAPIPGAALQKKDHIAIYFSAHWCPPCRAFTPKLVSLYNAVIKTHPNVEFIFASRDKDEAQFKDYYAEMPWSTLPFQHPAVQELAKKFEIQGIPTLVVLKGDGTVVNDDARGAAGEDSDGSKFPWGPEKLPIVTDFVPSDGIVEALNSNVVFILNPNGCPNKETQIAEFRKAAGTFQPEVRDSAPANFLIVQEAGEDLFQRVLQVMEVSAPAAGKPFVLAACLPNDKAKELAAGDVHEANVVELARRFYKANAEEDD